MKKRKRKNHYTRMYMKKFNWKAECPEDCKIHGLVTHNTCLVCPACKNSPHVPKLYKSKNEIKRSNRFAEQMG